MLSVVLFNPSLSTTIFEDSMSFVIYRIRIKSKFLRVIYVFFFTKYLYQKIVQKLTTDDKNVYS